MWTESWREMQRGQQEGPAACAVGQTSGCENVLIIAMGLLIALGVLLCMLMSVLAY